MSAFDLTLYLVVGSADLRGRSLEALVRAAVAGGVTLVQLREKDKTTAQVIEFGRPLKSLLDELQVPLIMNDNLEAALALDAAGLHVGQDDLAPALARRALPAGKILGLSISNEAEADAVPTALVDYIGIGPAFTTATKLDAGDALGPEGVARLRRRCALPACAIGGIAENNAASLNSAGLQGLAVVSAICAAQDPKGAAQSLRRVFRATP